MTTDRLKKCICNKYFYFMFVFVSLLIYSTILGYTADELRHDPWDYWNTGDVMWTWRSGKLFTFTEFPNTFRGYFVYFIFMLVKHGFAIIFNDAYLGLRFFSAISLSLLFTIVLPYIFDMKIEKRGKYLIRYIALIILFMYVYGGQFQIPSADWTSATFFIVAIALIKKLCSIRTWFLASILSFIIGVLLYASYNTRVVWLTGIIIALICMAINLYKKNPKRLLLFIGVFMGALLIAFPQMQINHKYTGIWSPKVNTSQLYGDVSLEKVHFAMGLMYPRYETYDGDYAVYPEAGVFFDDKVGYEIMEREGLTIYNVTPGVLIRLFIKYPGDMIGIYSRHILNAAVPLWDRMCILDIYTSKMLRISLAIWSWIIAAIAFFIGFRLNKQDVMKYIFIAETSMPWLFQCVGAVESRHLLACFIILFFYLCCMIDYKLLWNATKGKRVKILLVSLFVYFTWISVIGDTLAMNRYTTLLINDYVK